MKIRDMAGNMALENFGRRVRHVDPLLKEICCNIGWCTNPIQIYVRDIKLPEKRMQPPRYIDTENQWWDWPREGDLSQYPLWWRKPLTYEVSILLSLSAPHLTSAVA